MDRMFENRYFNTYYYANIVSNILSRDVELIGFISNFFSDEGIIYHLAQPFQKRSAFHCFIEYMVAEFFTHDMYEYDQKEFEYYTINKDRLHLLYAEIAFKEYDIDYSFKEFMGEKEVNDYKYIEDYHDELMMTGYLEMLFEKIADEVFYLMFNNRWALLEFNYIVAEHMDVDLELIEDDEVKKLFTQDGKVKRVKIPEWCKKAVFFRDRGLCCLCHKDLTGLQRVGSKKHYDHIIPLAEGGLNDVSNIQLLCETCNTKKNKHEIITSRKYESWY